MFELNLTEATSSFSSVTSGSVNLTSQGLGEIYTFGMWGYCKGVSKDGEYDVTYCSEPMGLYIFDPLSLFEDELGVSISLPNKVEDFVDASKVLSKIIFITGLIGAGTTFLAGAFSVFSFKSRAFSCIGMLFVFISFVALIICGAVSTAMFSSFEKYFNNESLKYGITASLGNKRFYGLIWTAVALTFIVCVLSFFTMCCGKSRSKMIQPVEQPAMQPAMQYTDRRYPSDYKQPSY